METRASLRGVRLSAQKGRLVADLVRGKPVGQALNILAFCPKKGAGIVKKVLESAIANAEHNDGADIDELTVKTIYVEKGMVLKRFTARAKGRGRAMGQKIHPTGFRLAVTKNWGSRWYANSKDFPGMLHEDIKVREYLKRKLAHASVGRVLIERPAKNARVTVYSARPGVVIGKKGEDIEQLRTDLQRIMGVPVHVSIEEIRKPELDAQLIADSIAQQLEKRIMFRRAMKRAMQNAMRLGAQGIKVMSAGRLNGAEIARSEWYREGRVPLHTLRADIDYATSEALTTYGIIGIKVWVYKGDMLDRNEQPAGEEPAGEDRRSRRTPAKPEGDKPRTRTVLNMLQPSRTKFRKAHKGRNEGVATRGAKVSFGEWGLKATGRGRLTARQIEAARRAMTRHIKRGGRIWIRIFPDKPVSKKPLEVRMGNGKGNPEYWVAEIQPGKVLYEMDGVNEALAREAFALAAAKLPIATTFVTRHLG
ncbi:hypothetical protein B566_EDAN003281 [Ephemera danica]|nr:hypothetical protein B566_EDAN003281 [Ephemera danica]